MTDMWIAENAIWTSMLTPIFVILGTLMLSYLMSFVSKRTAENFLRTGLYFGLISFALSWVIVLLNVLAVL